MRAVVWPVLLLCVRAVVWPVLVLCVYAVVWPVLVLCVYGVVWPVLVFCVCAESCREKRDPRARQPHRHCGRDWNKQYTHSNFFLLPRPVYGLFD